MSTLLTSVLRQRYFEVFEIRYARSGVVKEGHNCRRTGGRNNIDTVRYSKRRKTVGILSVGRWNPLSRLPEEKVPPTQSSVEMKQKEYIQYLSTSMRGSCWTVLSLTRYKTLSSADLVRLKPLRDADYAAK